MGMYIPEPRLEPKEDPMYVCPVCGDPLNYDDKVYRKFGGEIVGCKFCIEINDAEDVEHLLDKEC